MLHPGVMLTSRHVLQDDLDEHLERGVAERAAGRVRHIDRVVLRVAHNRLETSNRSGSVDIHSEVSSSQSPTSLHHGACTYTGNEKITFKELNSALPSS